MRVNDKGRCQAPVAELVLLREIAHSSAGEKSHRIDRKYSRPSDSTLGFTLK